MNPTNLTVYIKKIYLYNVLLFLIFDNSSRFLKKNVIQSTTITIATTKITRNTVLMINKNINIIVS